MKNAWKENKKVKKLKKTFQKGIDNAKALWYNNKVVATKGRRTVIENWTTRDKYKAKKQVQISSKSYIYSTKVKEAKIK